MARINTKQIDLPVTFVDLKDGEAAPRLAAYQLDAAGRPVKKLGSYDGKTLRLEAAETKSIALGPDI